MFKMGCSMARRILGPGSAGGGTNQEQSATCFSAPSSSSSGHQDTSSQRQKGGAGLGGGSARAKSTPGGGENNTATGAGSPKQSQPSSELNDFSKLEDDPRLPLNVRQIFKITKSWKAIARTMSKTGTAMFLNLFEQNQDLFYLFDRFQHLKGKELHESMELREHAATVMATLDTSINSLSDYDNFVSYLHSIGQLHRKVPGFKREYFWKIEQPFMKAVKQTLDERCNETIEEIYKIAIKLIIETIADGYGHEPDAADGMENNSSQPGEDDDEGDPSDNNNNRKRRAADNEGSRGQSSAPDNGEGNNNNSTGRNNNNNSGGARGRQAGAQFNAGSRPSGGKQQNQQTSNCNSATQAGPQPTGRPGRLKCGSNCCCCGDRSSNNSNYNKPMVKSEMVSVLRYPSLVAKRELSKIVILTNRARFQWRQRRMATKLTEAAVEAFAANHQEPIEHEEETKETFKSKLEQQQQQQQQQQQADNCRELDPEGAKLILATCELMNTTKNLIDSCESYADQLTGQPSAQRAARKLASWKSLLTNLNSSLLNEKGQSRLQDDNLRAKMNAIKDQQHQQRQQSAARTSTTGTTASVFQGQQQQQEEEAEDNFNDNEQLDLPCEPLPNGKRRMNRTTSQAHKIIFCPMRHSDESILASGHIGTPPADDVEICGAIRRRRQEGDQNGRAEGKSGDNERANVSCMVAGDGFGNDVVANTTTSEPPHVGLGAVVDEMAKRTHEDCSQELEKQIAKIELETATSDDDDDDDDDDDEKHNRARESLSMACPILGQNSSRASVASNNTRTNDERSSRSTDSMRGSQATNSTTGTQLEQQPPADSSSTTRSANNSSANWSSSSSNSANRPKQSSFCLVGGEQKQQQQQQQQQQAKTAAGELPFSSEHNENLYRVSGDSSGPGQSGVNELSEARPSSIKISVEAAEADEEEEEEETKLEKEDQEEASLARQEPLFVTKSKKRFKLIWTSNGDVGQEEDSAEPVRCQQSQQTLLSTLLARVGASSSNHGNCSNDGGESYRIANNNNDSANASTIIGGINPNTDAAISRTAACLTGGRGSGESGAEFRTVALLHKGEISVENLLHSIERRRDKTYPDGRVSSAGDNDDEDGGGGGDLIEFIRVIILINKLILALASSSIKEASRSGPPSETTFCKTTLVN